MLPVHLVIFLPAAGPTPHEIALSEGPSTLWPKNIFLLEFNTVSQLDVIFHSHNPVPYIFSNRSIVAGPKPA